MVQAGGFGIFTSEKASPLSTTLSENLLTRLGGLRSPFVAEGTSASVGDAQTLALILSYFAGDHFAVQLDAGIPPEFKLTGKGQVTPPGLAGVVTSIDLDDPANQPAATAKQWSPAVLLRLYFRDADARLRPFVSLGATYVFFTDERVNSPLAQTLEDDFGRLLALTQLDLGQTKASASAQGGVFPVFNTGLSLAFDSRWGLAGSLSYNRTKVDSRILIRAADDEKLSETRTHLEIDTLVVALLLTYRFRLD